MLVALRLCLGCHFLYEGVWKIKNADKFSAAPFLSEAKGPAAPLFYAMLPDIHGRERLQIEHKKSADGKSEVPVVKADSFVATWEAMKNKAVSDYGLSEQQTADADKLLARYKDGLQEYLKANAEKIDTYFKSLDRFQKEQADGNNGAAHQQERTWKRERELRQEAATWINDIDKLGRDFRLGIWNLLTDKQQEMGRISTGWNPLNWTRTEQINFAVTYALTAIGLCLMLGFCTRLAALGGGAFMLSVVLTQPAWPGIYPPDPAVVGHALMINKDFIEMVALFMIATTAVGRWGGLDYFVHHLLVHPFLSKKLLGNKKEG